MADYARCMTNASDQPSCWPAENQPTSALDLLTCVARRGVDTLRGEVCCYERFDTHKNDVSRGAADERLDRADALEDALRTTRTVCGEDRDCATRLLAHTIYGALPLVTD